MWTCCHCSSTYGYIEVGSHLKTPHAAIWVVCSESHYTVLYSMGGEGAMKARERGRVEFDLIYYDQLIRQTEEIRLDGGLHLGSAPAARSADLEPPLNDCIRTRWGKGAHIHWNGTEPIL